MRARIQAIARQFPDRVGAALRIETEVIATECKRVTPVDLGNLVNSIHVVGPEIRGRNVGTAIVAGGPSAPYALIVHEDLDAQHGPGKQAKYIEQPLMQAAPELPRKIGERVVIVGGDRLS